MGQTSKTLLTALIISLFSLTAVQGIKLVNQNSMSKVLGDTTIPSPPSVQQGVPCSLINTWQQRFCSGSPISPPPTRSPSPTPTICQPSATQVSNVICKYNPNLLHSAKYQCQDKTYVTVGDVSNVNCFDKQVLYEQAYSRCKSNCDTRPIPTPYPITPTSIRYPTVTPTRSPTPTAIQPTPTISNPSPYIERSSIINTNTCFYGRNFFGPVSYPTTTTPKIDYYYQGQLIFTETMFEVNRHGIWEDQKVCTTLENIVFQGKTYINVAITNYSQQQSNWYYHAFN